MPFNFQRKEDDKIKQPNTKENFNKVIDSRHKSYRFKFQEFPNENELFEQLKENEIARSGKFTKAMLKYHNLEHHEKYDPQKDKI